MNQRSFVQTSIVLRALTLVIVSSQMMSIVIQPMVLAGFLLVSKDMQLCFVDVYICSHILLYLPVLLNLTRETGQSSFVCQLLVENNATSALCLSK